jgi:hypothetical protein
MEYVNWNELQVRLPKEKLRARFISVSRIEYSTLSGGVGDDTGRARQTSGVAERLTGVQNNWR